MNTIIEERNYNISDTGLCMFTINLCNTMTRDLPDLYVLGALLY